MSPFVFERDEEAKLSVARPIALVRKEMVVWVVKVVVPCAVDIDEVVGMNDQAISPVEEREI